ncbi:hypothetical protein BTH42_31885 [Burkholderia sp. SRS-W-2-2016]|uniref:hypothetical protein n=1 Tax=Burkholderia sp. SRS-W-2-2016 TaxID=1926878 RepID=UPI00094AEBCD|nr:hypothetical protein [Burkholderia sp. SRS-W-2-2016]OLL27449.1 hypothetical protein BTH42_31885 [Burkholderia sp. SRS-W-2-2016]
MTDFRIEGKRVIFVSTRVPTLADYERAARVVLRDAENITHHVGGRLAALRDQDMRARALLCDACGTPARDLLLAINDALQSEQT